MERYTQSVKASFVEIVQDGAHARVKKELYALVYVHRK